MVESVVLPISTGGREIRKETQGAGVEERWHLATMARYMQWLHLLLSLLFRPVRLALLRWAVPFPGQRFLRPSQTCSVANSRVAIGPWAVDEMAGQRPLSLSHRLIIPATGVKRLPRLHPPSPAKTAAGHLSRIQMNPCSARVSHLSLVAVPIESGWMLSRIKIAQIKTDIWLNMHIQLFSARFSFRFGETAGRAAEPTPKQSTSPSVTLQPPIRCPSFFTIIFSGLFWKCPPIFYRRTKGLEVLW
jgi:hypothetical protein